MSDVSNGKEERAASGPRPGHGEDADERSGLPELALLSRAAGAVTGLVGALFRLCLDRADHLRNALVSWAHPWGVVGFVLITAACTIAAAVERALDPHDPGHAGQITQHVGEVGDGHEVREQEAGGPDGVSTRPWGHA